MGAMNQLSADLDEAVRVAGREFLQERADKLRALDKRVAADAVEAGRLLNECKSRLPHGYWLRWLRWEFGWSGKTANRFMQVHQFALVRGLFPSATGALTLDLGDLLGDLLALGQRPDPVKRVPDLVGEHVSHRALVKAQADRAEAAAGRASL